MPRHRLHTSSPLLALCLVLGTAEQAHALPPQAVVAGALALSWLGALVASAVALAAAALPSRLRWTLALGAALTVAVPAGSVFWPGSGPGSGPTATAETVPATLSAAPVDAPRELSIAGADAARWLGDPRTLWVDVRARSAYQDGHVQGAVTVPLILSHIFTPDLLDTLAADPTPLAHLAHDPDEQPDAWGALDAARYRGGLAVVETVARIEAMARRALATDSLDRVLLYCYSGRTSTPLAQLLRHRGLPAHVVTDGVNALPSRALARTTASERPPTGTPHTLEAPTRPTLAIWARAATPPAPLPAPSSGRAITLTHRDRRGEQRAAWAASLLEGWGYHHVRVAAHDAPASTDTAAAPAVTPWRSAWWALLAGLLALTATLPLLALRRRLRGTGTVGLALAGGVIQVGLLVFLDQIASVALGRVASAPLLDIWPVWWTEPLRLALALALAWQLLRPRSHRLVRAIEAARARFASAPPEPWPWPRLRASHVLLASAVGFGSGWALAPTVAASIAVLCIEPVATALWTRRLHRRVHGPTDPNQAARRLLRMAGIVPAPSGTAATHTVVTRRDGEPARASRIDADHREESVGLWSGGPDVRLAVEAAVILGADVTMTVDAQARGWVSVTLLETEGPTEALHAQLLTALWRGLRAGVPIAGWTDRVLRSDRYEEAAPEPTPLTLDVLRHRAAPEGAAGDAARRFGLRLARPVIVRLGAGVYDLEPGMPPTVARPGVTARLAARAVAASETSAPPRAPTLAALWRGIPARRAEEASRAVSIASAEVARLAAAAGVPAMPPLGPDDPRRALDASVTSDAPYELSGQETVDARAVASWPTAASLAYGPGPTALQRWRGVLRAAEARRDAARAVVHASTQQVGRALAGEHGEAVFHARLDALGRANWTSRAAERQTRWAEAETLPPTLDVAVLEALGRPAEKPSMTAVSGSVAGTGFPVRGVVTRQQPPAAGEVAVVARVDIEALGACPDGAAIVAERGSLLSHAAIVARERGRALVLGATGAVAAFEPGTTVTVDASGEVSAD